MADSSRPTPRYDLIRHLRLLYLEELSEDAISARLAYVVDPLIRELTDQGQEKAQGTAGQ